MILSVKGNVSEKVKQKLTVLNRFQQKQNIIFLFADYSDYEIPIGCQFSKIEINGEDFTVNDVLLIGVTQQFDKDFDYIPKGWKTIIVLAVNDKNVIKKFQDLPYIDDWYESNTKLLLKSADH